MSEYLLTPDRQKIAADKAADFDSIEFRSIFACGITLYLFTFLATIAVGMMARARLRSYDARVCGKNG